MGCIMPFLNIIGPVVIKLRLKRKVVTGGSGGAIAMPGSVIFRVTCWPTSSPVATQVTDKHIRALQKAFGVPVVQLFPKSVQELDETFAQREDDRPMKKPRHPRRKS